MLQRLVRSRDSALSQWEWSSEPLQGYFKRIKQKIFNERLKLVFIYKQYNSIEFAILLKVDLK